MSSNNHPEDAVDRLISASDELAAALQRHSNVLIMPELREGLAGFVTTLRAGLSPAAPAGEDKQDGERL